MDYDLAAEPRGPRRWPWVLAALIVLLVLAGVVVAAVTGRVLPYQADREQLTGTPFLIRAQGGVPAGELDRVRAGFVASHALFDDVLGGDVDGSVEVRLTWSQGCTPMLGPRSVGPAWADEDLICLNASHPAWRDGVARRIWYPALQAARTHVEVWQYALGCHVEDGEDAAWIGDAMVDHLAYEALRRSGLLPTGQGPADPLDPRGLADTCAAVGAGTPWPDAIREGLGEPAEQVRARLEEPGR